MESLTSEIIEMALVEHTEDYDEVNGNNLNNHSNESLDKTLDNNLDEINTELASMEEIEEIEMDVENTIKTIFDPEIPVNIWELGLIYDISVTKSREVVVLMTLTAPNCPEAGGIPIEVENRVKELTNVKDCKAILTFEPAWDMSRMTEAARFELGML